MTGHITIVITGSRWWGRPLKASCREERGMTIEQDEERVARERAVMLSSLADVRDSYRRITLVVGKAKGADTLAEEIGSAFEFDIVPFPYIGQLGRAGGVARNTQMIEFTVGVDCDARRCYTYHPDLGTSRGTKDCWQKATRAEIETVIWR